MPYEINPENVGNIYTHLTNFSLNKKNPTFRENKEEFEGEVKNVHSSNRDQLNEVAFPRHREALQRARFGFRSNLRENLRSDFEDNVGGR